MAIKPKTMKTQEYVKKEAEAKCNNWLGIGAYEDGLSAGIELARAFAEWGQRMKYKQSGGKKGNGEWYRQSAGYGGGEPHFYTTSELFEIFLTERNEK